MILLWEHALLRNFFSGVCSHVIVVTRARSPTASAHQDGYLEWGDDGGARNGGGGADGGGGTGGTGMARQQILRRQRAMGAPFGAA